jgi:transcriptional regulator with XRE-family HTH domain
MKYLTRYRSRMRLSQLELAQRLGISQQTISSWERGTRAPSIAELQRVSAQLRVTVSRLLSNPES